MTTDDQIRGLLPFTIAHHWVLVRPIHSGLSINITRALFLVIHRWIRHHRQRDSLRQGADEWPDTALAGHSATENETDGHCGD